MKVLVIAPPLIPIPPLLYGGVERIVYNLCYGLYSKGYEINLLAAKNSLSYRGTTNNYKIYRYGKNLFGRMFNWVEFQYQSLKLINNVDVIHSFVEWPELHFYLNQSKRPIIYNHQNPCYVDTFQRILRKNKEFGYLQCISNDQMKDIHINNFEKAFVTYNCVDTNLFKPQLKKKDDFVMYLGRLNYNKGIDIAVRLAIDSKIPLLIAGPLRENEVGAKILFEEKVKPYLNTQIKYIGEINDQQKIKLLSRSRALIVPNRWKEPFGIMNIEALACGTPIIATNKGSLKEIVKHTDTGYLCNNYNDLIEAMKNIDSLSNSNCRIDACNRFSTEKYISETEEIYKNFVY